jgi:hypothetical protein
MGEAEGTGGADFTEGNNDNKGEAFSTANALANRRQLLRENLNSAKI